MTPLRFIDLDDLNKSGLPESPIRRAAPKRVLLVRVEGTNDYTLTIDNSSLERFTTCARSAEYYLVLGREPVANKSALTFGGAVHKALEVKYLGDELMLKPEKERLQMEVLQEFFVQRPVPVDEYRHVDRAMDVVRKYNTKFSIEPWEIITDPRSGEPTVEVGFSLPLGKVEINDWIPCWEGGPEQFVNDLGSKQVDHLSRKPVFYVGTIYILWSGRIDLMVRDNEELWVVDHKTTSIMGEQFFSDFQLNNATVGYAWAGQQIMEQKVSGLILNAIAVRPPTPTGKATEFKRKKFIYSQDQIQEWHDNTLTLVSDFLYHLRRGFFPMQTKWCWGKYGKCPYHDVCTMPRKDRKEIIESNNFRDVTWNPLDVE